MKPLNRTHDAPPLAKRGKTARACDGCFRSKLACDGNSPCARCVSRQLTCTHSRARDSSVSASSSPTQHVGGSNAAFIAAGNESATPDSTSPKNGQQTETKIPVSFLLSLTNPEAESMIGAFLNEPSRDADIPTLDLPQDAISTDAGVDAQDSAYLIPTDGFGIPWFLTETFFTDTDSFSELASLDLPPADTTEGVDPALAPIVSELESLHRAITANTTNSCSPSPSTSVNNTSTNTPFYDPVLASQVFTRSNRDVFIPTYFRNVHKHLPLVHRPTFCVEVNPSSSASSSSSLPSSAPPLVLAVFLCGALYAPPRDSALAVPRFFAIAEEYIFRELERLLSVVLPLQNDRGRDGLSGGSEVAIDRADDGGKDRGGPDEEDAEMTMYQTFQAAMLVQGAQFMLNNPAARSKNFKARRIVLVDTARKLGLTRARHTQEVAEGGVPDWRRIATMLVLSGWQQSGVFHEPGPMVVYEMTGELPSLPELWEASDAAEFEAIIATRGSGCWRRSASLRDCMDAFMDPAWTGVNGFPLRNLTLLDMFILISTIHAMIGTAHHFSLLRASDPALRRATERWQELWETTVADVDSEVLRMSGFARHCGEFRWLAIALLDWTAAGRDKALPYFQSMGHETPRELHALLKELRDTARNQGLPPQASR
ncbi:hypothetical protein VTJ49DRAFT_507 [Mycothermus thermophilus]|uniref:Zn(2)-C6 fungal-type domain-containing protein n=1 Tax=Humicola insolens TaxID=85995 RepID=A0ABR3VF55_HUMIN